LVHLAKYDLSNRQEKVTLIRWTHSLDANAQDERDRKPREASHNGDEKAVGELLDEEAHVNAKYELSLTPLS
jgi:hypothetical protein